MYKKLLTKLRLVSIILEHSLEMSWSFFYLFNMHDFFNEVGRNETLPNRKLISFGFFMYAWLIV